MKLNINEHLENKNKLEQLQQKGNEQREEHTKKAREIYNKYWALEQDLRNKKHAEERAEEERAEQQKKELQEEKQQHEEMFKEMKYILYLYDLKDEKKNLKDYSVYCYDYVKKENGENDYSKDKEEQNYKEIDVLEDNDFLNLKVFITDNRKPKNCKSLIVVGSSFFVNWRAESEVLKQIPRTYGIDAHTKGDNIRASIKDFQNEKEALEYYYKNKDKILKQFREEHKKVEQDFKEVVEQIGNSKEWEIESLNNKKYYYENQYSNGTETDEYKQIVAKLKELGGL